MTAAAAAAAAATKSDTKMRDNARYEFDVRTIPNRPFVHRIQYRSYVHTIPNPMYVHRIRNRMNVHRIRNRMNVWLPGSPGMPCSQNSHIRFRIARS